MPRFAANISLLFRELPYADRFRAAADAGFEGVEILFPYEHPAKETYRGLLANGLEFVLMNAPPPNYAGGTPGYAALPDGAERFRSDMRRVLRFADELRPGLIHVMAGHDRSDAAFATFVANLQWLADLAPHRKFTIEPLNEVAQPGYFLNDYGLARVVLDAVARDNVGLQYDSYHAEMIHGDALAVWQDFGARAFHAQISAAPDRSEPRSADIAPLLAAMDDSGHSGWVSAEYHPTTPATAASLSWLRPFQTKKVMP